MDRVKRGGKSNPVLIAVGPRDKENHANPDVMLKTKKTGDVKKKPVLKNNKNMEVFNNQINNYQHNKKTICADDLTTKGSPGEAYWEQLSESRRVALDSALTENKQLHCKIMELEYENTKLKAMLAEAKNSINLLSEIAFDQESEDESVDDASFTSV